MKILLKLGNIIFGLYALMILWNSMEYFLNSIFLKPVSLIFRISILFVLGILFLFLIIFRKINIKFVFLRSLNKYIKIIIFVLMIIWQIGLFVSMPIIPIADPKNIYQIAQGNISNELANYISIYPNNYLMLIWEKLILNIIGNKYFLHGIIFLNLIFVDVSILLLSKLAQKKYPSISSSVFYMAVLFVGFSPQFLQAYTDIPAFFMGTILLYYGVQFRFEENFKRIALFSALFGSWIGLSYNMRAPLFIYAIAGAIVIIVAFLQSKPKNLIKCGISFLIVISGFISVNFLLHESLTKQQYFPYETGMSRTLFYFVDLGLTTNGATHSELTNEVLSARDSNRNKVYLNSIKNRISNMDLTDWINHLNNKFKANTSEGNMGWGLEAVLKEENLIPNRFSGTILASTLRSIVLVNFNGNYYWYTLVFQILWINIAFGMVLYSVSFKIEFLSINLWTQIIIFGGLTFLMIFEGGRSRYLIQFLPAIIWNASAGYERFLGRKKFYVE
ncbi:hypothetical protein ACTGWM_01365 [Streptococcus suis]